MCSQLIWFFYNLQLLQSTQFSGSEVDIKPSRKLDDSFLWHSSNDENNETSIKMTTCRNSVQGKVLIVDDKGNTNVLFE